MLDSAIHRINHYPADKRNENQLRCPLDWGLHRVIAKASSKRTQHCWMLHVASVCTPCCKVLGVVVQGLKPVKLLAPCKRAQHCWPTSPKCKKKLAIFCEYLILWLQKSPTLPIG